MIVKGSLARRSWQSIIYTSSQTSVGDSLLSYNRTSTFMDSFTPRKRATTHGTPHTLQSRLTGIVEIPGENGWHSAG